MDARTRELQHLGQQAREGVVCCGVVLRLPSEQCAGSGLGIDIEPSRSVAVMELPYLGLPSLFTLTRVGRFGAAAAAAAARRGSHGGGDRV